MSSVPRKPSAPSERGLVNFRPLTESLEARRLLSAESLFAASINFQPAKAPPAAGYLQDNGAVFADRGNGLTYGWTVKETKNARIRKDNLNADERYNTFVAFRPGQGWELAVPDGTYSVHLAIGDPSTPSGLHVVDVEGSPLSYAASKQQRWGEWTIDVTVSDGILLISAPTHVKRFKSDALDYVGISQTVGSAAPTPSPTPAPTPTPTPTPTTTSTPAPTPTPTPTPSPTSTPTSTTSGDFLYVLLDPENIQGSADEPHEIAVYNISDGNQWVKNIPLPSDTYNIRGAAACAATGRLYIAFTDTPADGVFPGGLLCMNLNTNAVVWQQNYPASVTPSVDRFDLTPDGSTIYLPVGEGATQDFVTIINAATGATEGRITTMASSHDLISSGPYTFVEGQEKGPQGPQFHHSIAVIDDATNQVVETIGPFNNVVRPFTVNASNTLVYATENNFIGFQIASVATGKVLFTVPVPGRSQDLGGGNIVNHGIAITPDGNYLYLVDSSRDGVYVFNVAGAANGVAPTYIGFIPTRKPGDNPAGQPDPAQTDDPTGLPGWIMASYNGQYMYTEGGDVISTAANTVVGNLRAGSANSSGQTVLGDDIHSRTMIEVDFNDGVAVQTSDQFGIGHD